MLSTIPSGRKYPVILKSFSPTQSIPVRMETVNNDWEYTNFCAIADKYNFRVTEEKSSEIIRQEAQDAAIKKERENTVHLLNTYNLKNAKRVYRTYPVTQGLAWTGAIVAIVLGYLKAAETFRFWPYYK